jgi:ATP-dependent helicase/nuclease subunit A
VHRALQEVSLPAAEDRAGVADRCARAEGCAERAGAVADGVAAALAAPIVREVLAAGRYWREVPVATTVGGALLEGFVDLVGETADGLVVVDYKTDTGDPDELTTRYRLQLAAYAEALERVTGRPVARAVLVLCAGPGPADQREIPDLGAATEEVRRALA